jgi:hypothetical protein
MARLSFPQRVALVLLLLTVILAPQAMVAQPLLEARQNRFLDALITEWRGRIWNLLNRSWEKEGCVIDPHGGCAKDGTRKTERRHDGMWEKNGCVIDPHGGSVCGKGRAVDPTAQGDAGCGLDPNGSCGH